MKQETWWEIEDPKTVLTQVIQIATARTGDVVVARVDVQSQQATATRTLTVPPPPIPTGIPVGDEEQRCLFVSELSRLVRAAAEDMAPPHEWRKDDRGGYTAVFITMVCREGRVVDTEAEWRWMQAWRYSNHFRDGFDGDVYVVTPYGWTGVMDQRCGLDPRVTATAHPPRLRAI